MMLLNWSGLCVTDRDAEDRLHGVCREAVLPGRQVSGNKTLHNTDGFKTWLTATTGSNTASGSVLHQKSKLQTVNHEDIVGPEGVSRGNIMLLPESKAFILCTEACLGHLSSLKLDFCFSWLHVGAHVQIYTDERKQTESHTHTTGCHGVFQNELSLTFPLNENFNVLLRHIFKHGSVSSCLGVLMKPVSVHIGHKPGLLNIPYKVTNVIHFTCQWF